MREMLWELISRKEESYDFMEEIDCHGACTAMIITGLESSQADAGAVEKKIEPGLNPQCYTK